AGQAIPGPQGTGNSPMRVPARRGKSACPLLPPRRPSGRDSLEACYASPRWRWTLHCRGNFREDGAVRSCSPGPGWRSLATCGPLAPLAPRAPAHGRAQIPELRLKIDTPVNATVVGGTDRSLFVAGTASGYAGEPQPFDIVVVLDQSRSTGEPSGADLNKN